MKLIEALGDEPQLEPTPSQTQSQGSEGDFKSFLRDNKTGLKLFIKLKDLYRDKGLLSSNEAKELMSNLLTLYNGTTSTQFGKQKWEPDELAFASFLDQIGDTPLGEFLGIESSEGLPGASVEDQADAIRQKAIQKPEEAPIPQLSSFTPTLAQQLKKLAEGKRVSFGRGSRFRLLSAALRAPKPSKP